MRLGLACLVLMVGLGATACATRHVPPAGTAPDSALLGRACAARAGDAVAWLPASATDRPTLDAWCAGVGAPLVWAPASPTLTVPELTHLTVVTWNADLDEGHFADLVDDLRAGSLTGGAPVRHFVLLVQDVFRRGSDVPDFADSARSAAAIATAADARDVRSLAHHLGLSIVYVPSMRNGAARREDRGSAILSTEPLVDPIGLELPFERQRRVVVGATVHVATPRGVEPLRLMNVHFDPLSASGSLWLFRNPRPRQMAAVLAALGTEPLTAGTVLGGDFNTIQGGTTEVAYRLARAWSTSLAQEDPRGTHRMGRLDYLFFRLTPPWQATSQRADHRYGSDHFPVVGAFTAAPDEPE